MNLRPSTSGTNFPLLVTRLNEFSVSLGKLSSRKNSARVSGKVARAETHISVQIRRAAELEAAKHAKGNLEAKSRLPQSTTPSAWLSPLVLTEVALSCSHGVDAEAARLKKAGRTSRNRASVTLIAIRARLV